MGVEEYGRIKTVFILGIDGYIGRPLSAYLESKGYNITGLDNLSRRDRADSLIPLENERKNIIKLDLESLEELPSCDAIIHLAEQPSAPWSMADYNWSAKTQHENVIGTLKLLWLMKEKNPNAHLIKLGSMGEYGTPDCIIPEGIIEDGPMKGLVFPRQPGSFYHLSKVFDSMNIDFACKTWGLRSTDIMQGVVFGHIDGTRFDYDEYFGTVINRFCTQAVAGAPLTVYGRGGQTRGYLPLEDSIACITLLLENPPKPGEYRIVNQFAKVRSINELAIMVSAAAKKHGIDCTIESIPNPRVESEHHEYIPKCDILQKLGYKPNWELSEKLEELIAKIIPYKDRIDRSKIMPTTTWR